MISKSIRYSYISFEFLLGLVSIYLLILLYGSAIPVGELKEEDEMYVFIISNGLHTDICMPAKTDECDWHDFVPTRDFPCATHFEYISVGWGDKAFFFDIPTWSQFKLSTAFRAAMLPTETAMHVAYMRKPKESEQCIKVYVSKQKYRQIVREIKKSFDLHEGNVKIISGRGYRSNDNFYEAKNAYHLFNTCNTWTNRILKTAHIRTGVYVLHPEGILGHLQP